MSELLAVDLTVAIRAETSVADPDTCKFTLSRAVRSGGPFFFKNRERAAGSPLAEQLFALVGVAHVLVADNVVTVGKEASASWTELKSAIGAAIRTQLLSGTPGIGDLSPAMAGAPVDLSGDVAERIRAVLEQRVNPSIAAHGGRAELVAVEDDAAYLRLSGGCAGCGMAAVTLSQGIEVALRESVPEITRVIDVTDHAAGTNPYYEKAKK